MEVHVRNAPQQGSQKGFKNFMRPHLVKLSIRSFYCQKFKTYASLTFLNIKDAERFLAAHGQTRTNSIHRSNRLNNTTVILKFMNQPVYFERSHKAAQPQLLKVLAKEEKDRQAHLENQSTTLALRKEQSAAPKIFPASFEAYSVSCGVWDYDSRSDLIFAPQLTWNTGGVAKFIEGSMILRLNNSMRIDFPFSSTSTILSESGSNPSFIFSMEEPPRFFQTIVDPLQDLFDQLAINNRVPAPRNAAQKDRHRLPYLDDNHKPIAANCLVWRIALRGENNVTKVSDSLDKNMHALQKAHGIPSMIYGHTAITTWAQTYAEGAAILHEELSSMNCDLPFKLRFQVLKLLNNNYLNPATLLAILPEITAISERSTVATTVATVKRFATQIYFPGPNVEADSFRFETLIELLRENETQFKRNGLLLSGFDTDITSNNQAVIHRAKVTPTGILLYGPQPECNNRVLRKFPDHHDHFLRVLFCDEDGLQVRFSQKISNDRLLSTAQNNDKTFPGRFKDVFENGIIIADKKFDVLGWSHSSLRAHSCWFVAPFIYDGNLMTAANIIRDLGDFTSITSPAKCAARIGQTFSDTPTSVAIDPTILRLDKDVERDGRVYSDGVGTMSEELMNKIWDSLPKQRRGPKPTCFQIRYSGAKGMLSLDSRLSGEQLVLRPSMIKFDGTDIRNIEICEGAWKPLPLFLNRQFIKILEDMGVDEQFFLKNQEIEVERLRSITANPVNASAFLKRQSIGEVMHLPWLINKLTALSLDFRADGFLRDVLEMGLLMELRLLKHKTRIPIEQGWHLHGIMDETGLLEEGQIFCVVNIDGTTQAIVKKRLVISRAPALHPGDIQVVEGVNVPFGSPLEKLRNCIVFSQKGQRDLPSMLSGGDLDGDRYYVIWDEDALPKVTFTPASYPRLPPIDIGRQVESKDMNNFFLDFMQTDQLGRIAVLHRILADQKDRGTLDKDCITLAEMHSTAVDYSKTGIPVDMSLLPKYPQWRPDFEAPGPHVLIEKINGLSLDRPDYQDPDDDPDEDEEFTRYRYYASSRILGKLFRAIDEQKIFEEIQKHSRQITLHTSGVIASVWTYVQFKCKLIQWEHKLEWARDIRDEYEECLRSIMAEYSEHPHRPVSELEAFVGNILGKTGSQTKHQRELSTNLKERFDNDVAFIVNCIIREDAESMEHSPEALEKSMACLAVSLEEGRVSARKGQIVSFKYVAAGICLREVERVFPF